MGSIKDKAIKPKKSDVYTLSSEDFGILNELYKTRQAAYKDATDNISAMLYYLAITRFGYNRGQDLSFEMNFETEGKKPQIKITKN